MKPTCRTLIVTFAGVMSALLLGSQAYAGCGQYQPRVAPSSWQPGFAPAQLLKAGFFIGGREEEETTSTEPSIVGLWKEHWLFPDGTEFDANYSTWHSDGTELGVSGLRTPMSGDVCQGVWEKVGPRHYKVNHFGVSFDASGLNLVGLAIIRQDVTLNPKGNEIAGTFSVDQYDESGNILAHVQGTISGTRVTMSTGYQKVE